MNINNGELVRQGTSFKDIESMQGKIEINYSLVELNWVLDSLDGSQDNLWKKNECISDKAYLWSGNLSVL